MSRAIVETNKRQDVSDKKNRMLREQLVSVRQQIKQTTPKPKEST
jgi:hypothetical protein